MVCLGLLGFMETLWAFNKRLGPDMQEVIDMIEPCDVLITHGPSMFTGDLASNNGQHVGCPHL